MRAFARLCAALEANGRAETKRDLLRAYFLAASPPDAAWAARLLTGHRLGKRIGRRDFRAGTIAAAAIPEWLFAAAHEAVGDLAETASLVVPGRAREEAALAPWIELRLLPLADLPGAQARAALADLLLGLDRETRLVAAKLLLGTFRPAVAPRVVHSVLGELAAVSAEAVARTLAALALSTPRFWDELREAAATPGTPAMPYALAIARALDRPIGELGERAAWHAEWTWPGTRVQIARARDDVALWSASGEALTDRFPDIVAAAEALPVGTVLDGVLVAWDRARDAADVGSMPPSRRHPALVVFAFDLLRAADVDARDWPFGQRRRTLETLLAGDPHLRIAPTVAGTSWEALAAARGDCRDRGASGIALKRLDAPYPSDAQSQDWWSWPVEPHRLRALLVYAEPGAGHRASVLASLTFALREGGELVTFGSTDEGLSDADARAVDRWTRSHTLERFGPVRRVEPSQVFDLALASVAPSPRHKSGLAVRDLRIVRWRKDLAPEDADDLARLRAWATPGAERA